MKKMNDVDKLLKELEDDKIKETINAKDLFNMLSIREETDDQYGRKGRGITLVYFNKKYEDFKFMVVKK